MRRIQIAELSKDWADLLEAARHARQFAYAPYSKYAVGAAVRTRRGATYEGCNIENAVNRLSTCAEQLAIWKALSEGDREIEALALVSEMGSTPCGGCRQGMVEFAPELPLLVADEDGHAWLTSLPELLPDSYSRKDMDSALKRPRPSPDRGAAE